MNRAVLFIMVTTLNSADFLILGGGLAGLTTARELLRRGQRVIVVEKNQTVGGLARTIERDGFRFDLGGHRFHSNNVMVVDWLHKLLGEELLTVPRQSHIYLNNRYVAYPLRLPDALTAFAPPQAAAMLASYALARWKRHKRNDISFADWVINRFGAAMFRHFFEPYTEKVWGISCGELSAEWAAQRIGIPSLWQTVQQAIRPNQTPPPTAITQFYYPRHGFGMIADTLASEIVAQGGTLLTDMLPVQIERVGSRYAVHLADGTQIVTNHIVSTIPLGALQRLLRLKSTHNLDYRGLICIFLALDQAQVSSDSWTYFPDKRLIFGRIHEPKNWSSAMIPDPSVTSLCVEIFASPHDATWQQPNESLIAKTVEQLQALGLVRPNALRSSWAMRLPHAYPIYRVGYAQKLSAAKEMLTAFPNLHLVGRTGSFRYMNSDGVIEDVFRFLSERQLDTTAIPISTKTGRWV